MRLEELMDTMSAPSPEPWRKSKSKMRLHRLVSTSPVTQNQRGKLVSCQQRQMIINLFKKYDGNEAIAKKKKTDLLQNISMNTGISVRTIFRVVNSYIQERNVTSPKRNRDRYHSTLFAQMDECQLNGIRRLVHSFFFKNEIPTVDKVMLVINDDPDFPNFKRTTFWKLLKKLNFVYQKRGRNSILLDRGDIVTWRRSYLRSIKKYRHEGRPIYYLDETWINAGHTTSKCWSDTSVKSAKEAFSKGLSCGLKNPTGKGGRIIILHIGNEHGFVEDGLFVCDSRKTNDYHEEMTAEVFEEWFKGDLISL